MSTKSGPAAQALDLIISIAIELRNNLPVQNCSNSTAQPSFIKKIEPLLSHPFGNVIKEKWLAVKVVSKDAYSNTAAIYVQFPDEKASHAYWYDPAKIEIDDGFMWNVEEGKHYIVLNQRFDKRPVWMWEKIWEVPESVYNHISFKIGNAPPLDLIRRLEDELLSLENIELNPIQLKMQERAVNRKKLQAML